MLKAMKHMFNFLKISFQNSKEEVHRLYDLKFLDKLIRSSSPKMSSH